MKARDMPCSWLALAVERSRWTALPFDLCVQRPRRWFYELRRRSGSLTRHEARSYSQNGEDGILAKFFAASAPLTNLLSSSASRTAVNAAPAS